MPRGVYERKERPRVDVVQELRAATTREKPAAASKDDMPNMALLAIRGYIMAMRMASEIPSISDMLRIETIVDKGLGDVESN